MSGQEKSESPLRMLVNPSVAAWVVGRRGQTIQELRSKSGADVDIVRTGGSERIVELFGPHDARMTAIGMLLETIEALPDGAPEQVEILVPAAAMGHIDGRIAEIQTESEASLHFAEPRPGGAWVLAVSGSLAATTKAVQLVCAGLAELPYEDCASTTPAESATSLARDWDIVGRALGQSTDELFAGPVQAAGGAVPSPCPNSNAWNASEAALLRALLAGPGIDQARLQLILPLGFVTSVLVSQGHLRQVASRSGSKLELGRVDPVSAAQFVNITGTMIGNSMAALYIQELMMGQHLGKV